VPITEASMRVVGGVFAIRVKWARLSGGGRLAQFAGPLRRRLDRSIARFYRLENPARVGMLRPCF